MTQLVQLQLPIEIVQSLLKNMEEFEETCVATREYLESGLCSDSGMLGMDSPEEAVWAEAHCKAARSFIVDQLAQQGLTSLVTAAP
jgi:hypothetical protein